MKTALACCLAAGTIQARYLSFSNNRVVAMPLTMGQIINRINEKFGIRVGEWCVRRTLDRLAAAGKITVSRVGPYRAVSEDDVLVLIADLQRRKLLPRAVEQSV